MKKSKTMNEEYTINEDGEIVRASSILSTERIIVLLNTYGKLVKNKQRIIDTQKKRWQDLIRELVD